jgi:SAM-dependent methyltransferase
MPTPPESISRVSRLAREHLEKVAAEFDAAPDHHSWAALAYRAMLARHFRYFIPPDASVLEVGCGSGELLARLANRDVTGIDLSEKQLAQARARLPHGAFYRQAGECLAIGRSFDYIIVSDTLNLAADVQLLLERLLTVSSPRARLVINIQSQLWRPLLDGMSALRLRRRPVASNWLARDDVINLLQLAGWEVVRCSSAILCPLPLLGLDRLINRFVLPFVPALGLAVFLVARPRPAPVAAGPRTVSVILPARNEAGNIEAAVQRVPEMGLGTELIFVEGHSRDDTWREIERVKSAYPNRRIKALRQTGSGKGNAVREGFAAASGDILMILDTDLTVPPEELPKFYQAVAENRVEFANGSRLVYPMETRAMRFLNMCANKAIAAAFGWLLGQPLKDTLCGTKVLRREDYQMIAAHRDYFGDFDPFGDFDLLFGASKLSLKIGDIPIRYQDRAYGTTNIHRWRHGWLLLRMMIFAAKRVRFIG